MPVTAKNALRNTFTQTKDQTITDKEFNEILATYILKAYKAYNPNESSERLVKLILGCIPSVQSGLSGVNWFEWEKIGKKIHCLQLVVKKKIQKL